MSFTSKLYPGEIFVDHGTSSDLTHPVNFGRGYAGRPPGYASKASQGLPSHLMVPRSEYQARIQEIEERGLRMSERIIQENIPCKDQNGTNFCFGNAPVHCIEIGRMIQNQTYVDLSAASVAAPLSNFRNNGGSGTEALEYIAENGVMTLDDYPLNVVNGRKYMTDEAKQRALAYRCTEWWELMSVDEMFSYLLRLLGAVSNGWPWWGHETTGVDVVWLDGEAALRGRNSWGMDYGHKGFFIVRGNRLNFDECITPRVVVAS